MTTEERLENLERELARAKRRNRWLVAVAGLAVVGLILAWTLAKTTQAVLAQAAGGAEKVIRANTFIVEDANGKELAMLGVDAGRPVLYLFDENGKVRAMLGVGANGAAMGLFDENDNPRAWLAAVGDRAAVEVFDENGMSRARLDMTAGNPGLSLSDENGEPRAMLIAFKDGPGLSLRDANGKSRAMLGVDADGPVLALLDEKGKRRAALAAFAVGSGLEVSDENGKPRAMLGAFKDGPGLSLRDENGKVIWAAGVADGVATTPRQVTPPVKAAPPAPPPQSHTCPKCDGQGFVRDRSGGTFGITTARPCQFCRGTGKVTSMPPRRGDETVEEHEAAQRALKGLPPRAVEPAAPAVPSRVEPTAPDTSKSERCPFCGGAGGPTGEIRTVDGYPMRVFMCGQGHEWLKR